MTNNPNELTIENSLLLLIDHQPMVAFAVTSIDRTVMINNVAALAQTARDLGVPTVLTTVGAKGSILVDPIFKEIGDLFPGVTPIDRTSTHAWSHPEVRAAVDATGRKKLIMAGLVTEVCLCQSVLAALKDGFDVYFVSDCSGGITPESHEDEDAKARMIQAGARPMSWLAVYGEWAPDYTSPERAALADVTKQRGGSAALISDYVFAQVTAGLVPPPSFTSAPVKERAEDHRTRVRERALRTSETMAKPKIAVIINTTRLTRFGERPAKWIYDIAAATADTSGVKQ
jgi:nicotinamidase-related amidase